MRWAVSLLALLAVLSAGIVRAQEINWQEAVARLKQERTLAETCAAVLKKYGDAGAVDRGDNNRVPWIHARRPLVLDLVDQDDRVACDHAA